MAQFNKPHHFTHFTTSLDNNNNNIQDNFYDPVIIAEPFREFTGFT